LDGRRGKADRRANRANTTSHKWLLRVSAKAIPATSSPSAELELKLAAIHGGPQLGFASAIRLSGNMVMNPHIGPRRYHRSGQRVMPTMKPISMRAL